jgi:hypothetical protein
MKFHKIVETLAKKNMTAISVANYEYFGLSFKYFPNFFPFFCQKKNRLNWVFFKSFFSVLSINCLTLSKARPGLGL